MNSKNELQKYKKKVDDFLEAFLLKKEKEYNNISSFISEFISHLKEFTLRGGKRLRPALLYYTYTLFKKEDREEVAKLSIFIELIQSFLLIHDDIIDHANLRRGGKTIHKIYESYAKDKNYIEPKHFGKTMGILCGDLAMEFAIEIINSTNISFAKKNKVLSIMTKYINTVIFGQIHDVLLTYDDNYTQSDITRVHDLKTSTYTYKLPIEIGAYLANANKIELKRLLDYATPAGIAFQIRDDILGIFGNDEETGKENLLDLIEGKKTLLISKAIENGNDEQKKFIRKTLGMNNITEAEAKEFREIIKKTGSLNYSEKQTEKLINNAQQSLNYFNNKIYNSHAFTFLSDIAEYMIMRNI